MNKRNLELVRFYAAQIHQTIDKMIDICNDAIDELEQLAENEQTEKRVQ